MSKSNSLEDFELFYEELLQYKNGRKAKQPKKKPIQSVLANHRSNRLWDSIRSILRPRKSNNRSTRNNRKVKVSGKSLDNKRPRSTKGTTPSKRNILSTSKTKSSKH